VEHIERCWGALVMRGREKFRDFLFIDGFESLENVEKNYFWELSSVFVE
jgi:hypothetical protein